MGLTVNGNVIVKGDQLFDNSVKIVKYEGEAQKEEPLTEEVLKERVDFVKSRITNGRLWFPVCKFMMWKMLVPEGDFGSAVEILERLYPEEKLNAKDLASLNVLSFRKELAEWDENDCPLKDRTTFHTYKNIAELMMSV